MAQLDKLILAFIICLSALGIAIAGTYIVPTSSSEKSQNHGNEAGKVFVKVICGGDEILASQELAEAWIIQKTTELGSPYAWKLSDWMEVTENKQEIYSSSRGGRLIETQIIQGEQPEFVTVEITGFKIGTVPRQVTFQDKIGMRAVIKMTNYLRAKNIFLAFRLNKTLTE